MKYLKYRHKFSYRFDDWEYRVDQDYSLLSADELNGILEDIVSEYSYGEHYSGIDYELINPEDLPTEFIQTKLESLIDSLDYWTNDGIQRISHEIQHWQAVLRSRGINAIVPDDEPEETFWR